MVWDTADVQIQRRNFLSSLRKRAERKLADIRLSARLIGKIITCFNTIISFVLRNPISSLHPYFILIFNPYFTAPIRWKYHLLDLLPYWWRLVVSQELVSLRMNTVSGLAVCIPVHASRTLAWWNPLTRVQHTHKRLPCTRYMNAQWNIVDRNMLLSGVETNENRYMLGVTSGGQWGKYYCHGSAHHNMDLLSNATSATCVR